jgi:hypothetical protein
MATKAKAPTDLIGRYVIVKTHDYDEDMRHVEGLLLDMNDHGIQIKYDARGSNFTSFIPFEFIDNGPCIKQQRDKEKADGSFKPLDPPEKVEAFDFAAHTASFDIDSAETPYILFETVDRFGVRRKAFWGKFEGFEVKGVRYMTIEHGQKKTGHVPYSSLAEVYHKVSNKGKSTEEASTKPDAE